MDVNNWPPDWQRGLLDLCVLRVLATGPTYGYDLASQLNAAGLGDVKGGTLYPLLKRLETAGQVDIEWRPGESGPGRKFYRLNDLGQERLAQLTDAWARFSSTISGIVSGNTESRAS